MPTSLESQFRPIATQAADFYSVPQGVYENLIGQESGWREDVFFGQTVSSAGAQGGAQFMPATFQETVQRHPELLQMGLGDPSPFNPRFALFAGAAYLADNISFFNGDVAAGVAAYNAGPGRVQQVLAQQGELPEETRDYLDAVLGGLGMLGSAFGALLTTKLPPLPGGGGQTNEAFIADLEAALGHPLTQEEKRRILNVPMTDAQALQLLNFIREGDEQAFAQQLDLLARGQGFTSSEREAGQAFTSEEAQKAREFSERENRLRDAQDLIAMLSQQRIEAGRESVLARESAIDAIGRSPFRGAIQAQGVLGAGTDPHDRLRRQLGGFADELLAFSRESLPVFDPGASTGELEEFAATARRDLRSFPTQPQRPFGLAHGGTVTARGRRSPSVLNMERGADGVFDVEQGGTGFGVLVGRNDDELAEFMPDGSVRFVPIMGAASHGATVRRGPSVLSGTASSGGQGALPQLTTRQPAPVFNTAPLARDATATELDALLTGNLSSTDLQRRLQGFLSSDQIGTIQGLRPIFNAIGAGNAFPIGQRVPDAFGGLIRSPLFETGFGDTPVQGPFPQFSGEVFDALGTPPRLIFDPDLQAFFFVGDDNRIRIVGGAERLLQLGFRSTDAVMMPVSELQERVGVLGQDSINFPAATGADAFQQTPALSQDRPSFSDPASPIFAPLDETGNLGIFLPAARLLAPVWRQLDPGTQALARDIFGTAGINDIDRTIDFFTVSGTQSASRPRVLA